MVNATESPKLKFKKMRYQKGAIFLTLELPSPFTCVFTYVCLTLSTSFILVDISFSQQAPTFEPARRARMPKSIGLYSVRRRWPPGLHDVVFEFIVLHQEFEH
ncbi:hypothetical protein Y032_0026g1301 [Ancylostoma ceylanicum]|uniref:Uncharacterized protein n=1 Tax=Ancylostoma ceylanicum TaxID=53326 RepID=A0A016UTB4_9BILA|nr:hypothetical protein Y032_0026g1301 [Ancylostoma ceylanicum]